MTCINAAGAGPLAIAHTTRHRDRAWASPRALSDPADGSVAARERHSHAPRATEARPESGTRVDPHAAARAAGISRDREGVRPVARGAEVRAREGQQDPHAVPHLAEQDGRRALGAPA